MIERLIDSLRALGAPAESQLARFPGFAGGEVARDFADAFMLVSDCPQLRLTTAQREALERLEAQLDAMSAHAHAWTEDAVRDASEWAAARRFAREALDALHAPIEPTTRMS